MARRAGIALIVLLLGAAAGLQVLRDRRYAADLDASHQVLYVRSGRAVERMALSFDAILADVYWIRAIQHFGGQRLAEPHTRRYDLLYPFLDIATTLDPYFNIAYRFGAIFLSEGYPDGPARPDLAVKLLQKAQEAQPDKWQYPYDTGFIHYWWLHDYAGAAEWFRKARAIPGAPPWLDGLAAATLARGQDRAGSRLLWEQIRETAEHQYLRRTAEFRLRQLDAMDEIDRLNASLERVTRSVGPVTSWEALLSRRIVRRVPVDPAGVPYAIDPGTGRVTISERSPFFPLPDEPPRAVGLPAGESLSGPRER